MSSELVTVVIPCYNQARFLGEAIESVARQSYPHREVIVLMTARLINISD